MATHGHTLYDEVLRVPLILSRPGSIPAGRCVEDVVGLVDVLPTILDLLDLPVPTDVEGMSLEAKLFGETPPLDRTLYAMDLTGFRRMAVRTSARKIIFSRETGFPRRAGGILTQLSAEELARIGQRVELFDLRGDPGEHRNVAAGDLPARRQYAEIARRAWTRNLRGVILDMHTDTAPARVGVRLEGLQPLFVETPPWGRAGDRVVIGPEGCELVVDLSPGERRQFAVHPASPAGPLRLQVLVDGRPIEASRLRFGSELVPPEGEAEGDGIWGIDAARLVVESDLEIRALPLPAGGVAVRILQRSFPFDDAADADVDAETYDQLEALGYVDEP